MRKEGRERYRDDGTAQRVRRGAWRRVRANDVSVSFELVAITLGFALSSFKTYEKSKIFPDELNIFVIL